MTSRWPRDRVTTSPFSIDWDSSLPFSHFSKEPLIHVTEWQSWLIETEYLPFSHFSKEPLLHVTEWQLHPRTNEDQRWRRPRRRNEPPASLYIGTSRCVASVLRSTPLKFTCGPQTLGWNKSARTVESVCNESISTYTYSPGIRMTRDRVTT